jgi:DNA-binding NarL/FixJ family response regulator
MRVLLADDHRLLLEGLTNLLDAHGITVVGMAGDGQEALSLARSLRPDLILMDIRMPRCDGLCATRLIKAEMPDIKIVILTSSTEDRDLFEAVKSGACGYLLKSMDADQLVDALHQAQEGIPPFSPGLAQKLLDEFAHQKMSEPVAEARLTDRQRQVLELVAEGLSYKEIGNRLALSPRTIKYHMAEIMQVLHLEHRVQVLAYAGEMRQMADRERQ